MTRYATFGELFRPSRDFLDRRFADQQAYTRVMLWVFAPFSFSLWVWDLAIDPIGARDVVVYRVLMGLSIALPALVVGTQLISTAQKSRLLAAATWLAVLLFYAICMQLTDGFVYGIGGFMFLQLCGFLLWTGLSFPWIVLIHVVAVSLPHLLTELLGVPEFPHLRYAVLLWPATVLSLIGHYVAYSDYAAKVALRQRLVELASVDPLTGVLNRRTFMRSAHELVQTCQQQGAAVALIFIDADHFKRINDRHGHAAGDAVLVRLGALLRAQLRRQDLCCRWGGEEFVALLAQSDAQEAAQVALRTLAAIRGAEVVLHDGTALNFTASLGVCGAVAAGTSLDVLLRQADAAMYDAKAAGRDRVCVAGAAAHPAGPPLAMVERE